MTEIQKRLATGKGKFTPLYPELGTGPVDYEDCISPEFFEKEQLLYSMILVSYSVNVFMQPRIPDSGAAFFDAVTEPGV